MPTALGSDARTGDDCAAVPTEASPATTRPLLDAPMKPRRLIELITPPAGAQLSDTGHSCCGGAHLGRCQLNTLEGSCNQRVADNCQQRINANIEQRPGE